MQFVHRWAHAVCLTAVLVLGTSSVQAAPITGIAAMGASETRGRNFDGSWVPWLAVDRGLNFGPNQSFNVAVNGSTTSTLLSRNQHTDVAALVANGDVNLAYLFIGGLDVPPVALDMILGTLNVPNWADGVVSRMMTAVDTVLAEGPEGMVVAGLPDMTLVPGAASYASIPGLAAPVISAIDYTNALVKEEVLSRGQVYFDVASFMRDINAEPFVVGGVTIDTVIGSTDPTHFFVDDLHPGFVGNGVFANLMLTAMNVGFGTSHALFTDQEILARAGLSSSYTGETSNVNFTTYVHVVPEPSGGTLAFFAMLSAGSMAIRRRVARASARRSRCADRRAATRAVEAGARAVRRMAHRRGAHVVAQASVAAGDGLHAGQLAGAVPLHRARILGHR